MTFQEKLALALPDAHPLDLPDVEALMRKQVDVTKLTASKFAEHAADAYGQFLDLTERQVKNRVGARR